MRRIPLLFLASALLLIAAACGSSSDDESVAADDSASSADEAPAEASDDESEAPADEEPAEPESEASGDGDGGGEAAAPAGGSTATVTLANGETFEFSILCSLESQEAAGSEILFTVVSYDDPVNLDVTQFGADSFDGAANISLYDSETFDTLWDASTIVGGNVELTLDGSTVTGTGTFVRAGEIDGEQVEGELVANC